MKQQTEKRVPTPAERDFGRRMREALEAAGYKTIRARAAALSVALSAQQRYEAGIRRPKPEVIERLVERTGKDRLWFYGRDDNTVPRLLLQGFEEVLWRVVEEGVPLSAAIDDAVLDDRWLSPEGRRRMEELEPKLKVWLTRQAPTAWEELTAVGRSQICREVARFLVLMTYGESEEKSL